MIGIYEDNFIDFITKYLGKPKITNSNIICRCPWCEVDRKHHHHNHLYISLDKPIFNCFKSECNESGTIKKFIFKVAGTHQYNKYIDNNELENIKNYKKISTEKSIFKYSEDIKLPEIYSLNKFRNKIKYFKQRLLFAPFDITKIKGLILDVDEFISLNKNIIKLSDSDYKLLPYLQSNFIGFLLENKTKVIFRNIDTKNDFRYYKMNIQKDMDLLDYYKITHNIKESNLIVIGEGIFDIFNDHIFDYTGYRHIAYGYYCSLNQRFESLIKSIIFHDNLYNPNVVILSDGNIHINYYKKLKRKLKNFCENIEIYYNKNGDDFGDVICNPEKIYI